MRTSWPRLAYLARTIARVSRMLRRIGDLFGENRNLRVEIDQDVGVVEGELDRVAAVEIAAVAQHLGIEARADAADDAQLGVVEGDGLNLVAVAGEGGGLAGGEGELQRGAELGQQLARGILLVAEHNGHAHVEV